MKGRKHLFTPGRMAIFYSFLQCSSLSLAVSSHFTSRHLFHSRVNLTLIFFEEWPRNSKITALKGDICKRAISMSGVS